MSSQVFIFLVRMFQTEVHVRYIKCEAGPGQFSHSSSCSFCFPREELDVIRFDYVHIQTMLCRARGFLPKAPGAAIWQRGSTSEVLVPLCERPAKFLYKHFGKELP